jgi:hypothetical protein
VSAVAFPERLPPNVILMGVIQPARGPRKHLATVSLTIVTLAVLAAALVFTALNIGRIGAVRVFLSAILPAGVLMYVASGRRPSAITGGFTNALQAGHVTYPNPVGFLPRHGWYSNLLTVIFALSVVTAIGVVASVFARRRGASPERRLAASDSQDLSSVWVAMTTKLTKDPLSPGWLWTARRRVRGLAKVLCAGFSLRGTERDLGIPW